METLTVSAHTDINKWKKYIGKREGNNAPVGVIWQERFAV